jgi:alkylation response protein AidB-like acyl-CoA dehydrogenase
LAELKEGALRRAHEPGYPRDVAEKLSNMGMLGITIAEEDGGQGGTLMDAVIAIQETALVCPKSADVVQAGNFGAVRTFAAYASAETKARFLPDLLGGRKVMALGMTEPGAGSAVTELRTSARQEGDEYVINGTKIFSTNSPDAEVFLIYVRYGPGVGNIGSVLVERGSPGFTVGQPSNFMNGERWSQLYFEDCLSHRTARAIDWMVAAWCHRFLL